MKNRAHLRAADLPDSQLPHHFWPDLLQPGSAGIRTGDRHRKQALNSQILYQDPFSHKDSHIRHTAGHIRRSVLLHMVVLLERVSASESGPEWEQVLASVRVV